MQIFTKTRPIVAIAALLMVPFAMSAQETKKEVHIKIVENGVVTKDTVYNISGESPEIEYFAEMEAHHANMGKRHMEEKHVIVMSDSSDEDINWVEENGKQKEVHKEVKVIVNSGEGEDEMSEVEEIWVGGSGEGKPCRTIIIHEGECPGGNMEMDHLMTPPPPPPQHMDKKPVKVEKKVIKTEEGVKVIIIETSDDDQPKAKVKR